MYLLHQDITVLNINYISHSPNLTFVSSIKYH